MNKKYTEIFEETAAFGRSPLTRLCLEMDDIENMIERLRLFGVKTTEKKMGCDGPFQTWFKDPNGIDIQLQQYTSKSSQQTGEDMEIDW